MEHYSKNKNRLAFRSILLLTIICILPINSKATTAWPAWIPGTENITGWTIPKGGNFTSTIENILINPENGSSNDTKLYSQLFTSTGNFSLLVNYIDFEEATGINFTADIFSLKVPLAFKQEIANALADYTTQSFTGENMWELITFIFTQAWNNMIDEVIINTKLVTINKCPAVLLNYNGFGHVGHVAFINLGNKASIILDVGKNASWMNVSVFQSLIHSYLVDFLAPLKEILHLAHFNQYSIMPSGIEGHFNLDGLYPSQDTAFLDETQFLSIINNITRDIYVKEYPVQISTEQIILISLLITGIIVIIYIALTAYKKEDIPVGLKESETGN
ncbi:MAG: hypothetical protein ACTSVI_02960 [Promethearchaeota archaeon]